MKANGRLREKFLFYEENGLNFCFMCFFYLCQQVRNRGENKAKINCSLISKIEQLFMAKYILVTLYPCKSLIRSFTLLD